MSCIISPKHDRSTLRHCLAESNFDAPLFRLTILHVCKAQTRHVGSERLPQSSVTRSEWRLCVRERRRFPMYFRSHTLSLHAYTKPPLCTPTPFGYQQQLCLTSQNDKKKTAFAAHFVAVLKNVVSRRVVGQTPTLSSS